MRCIGRMRPSCMAVQAILLDCWSQWLWACTNNDSLRLYGPIRGTWYFFLRLMTPNHLTSPDIPYYTNLSRRPCQQEPFKQKLRCLQVVLTWWHLLGICDNRPMLKKKSTTLAHNTATSVRIFDTYSGKILRQIERSRRELQSRLRQ